jgi:hypothetical protein
MLIKSPLKLYHYPVVIASLNGYRQLLIVGEMIIQADKSRYVTVGIQ